MKISNNHNRFHHGAILNDMYKNRNFLSFGFLNIFDTQTNQPFTITKGNDYTEVANIHDDIRSPRTLKNWLKLADCNYPRNMDGELKDYPKSTTELTDKEVHEHQEFIRLVAVNNGYTLKIDQEEWDRMIQMYNR